MVLMNHPGAQGRGYDPIEDFFGSKLETADAAGEP